ncbi:MAG: GspMb/PilO family protein [Candidatus Fervidibacter sp.]|uniref:GspMb/PilO family protein n=1 Tax=Candidatus Fervidibacter sp. TaxID=3100871 RepID=UPI004049ABC1
MKDRHRLLLLSLLAIAMLSWLWMASAVWQYQSLRTQLRSLREQSDEVHRLIESAKEKNKRYNQLIQELGKPLAEFDLRQLNAKLMEQVEGALTQSKIKTEAIQPLPWQINSDLMAVRLSVQITATTTQPTIFEGLQSLTELLMRLRSMRPPIMVERLSIQALSQTQQGLRLQAQLVWYVPVEEAVLKKWAVQTRRPMTRR